MTLLTIDPGPVKSAYLLWNGATWIDGQADMPNAELRDLVLAGNYDLTAIEMVACMGMPVGKEVFDTVLWIGRFVEAVCHTYQPGPTRMVFRREIKSHFCNSMKAKDANIRQAILDRFGGKEKAVGLKATPGPLYGIKSHLWPALAIALYIEDQNK